jgi:hypothetical protein
MVIIVEFLKYITFIAAGIDDSKAFRNKYKTPLML